VGYIDNVMKGVKTSHARSPGGSLRRSETNPPRRILVVEDDTLLLRLNAEVLLHSGYEVDTAADGAAAWQALNANHYDLMITDNSMPEISGVELLAKLRAAQMSLPVIMATGTLPDEDLTQYPRLQPDAMLLKPYTLEEMVKTVQKVLNEVASAAFTACSSMQR
jgi:DNA-binding response OmpR family regulator